MQVLERHPKVLQGKARTGAAPGNPHAPVSPPDPAQSHSPFAAQSSGNPCLNPLVWWFNVSVGHLSHFSMYAQNTSPKCSTQRLAMLSTDILEKQSTTQIPQGPSSAAPVGRSQRRRGGACSGSAACAARQAQDPPPPTARARAWWTLRTASARPCSVADAKTPR
jgi:hypothetical protein